MLKITTVFAFVLFAQINVNAQLLNRLKDRAIQKVEQRVEDRLMHETDKKVDQALDSLENKVFDDEEAQPKILEDNSNATVGNDDYHNNHVDSETEQNLNAMLGQLSQITAAEYEQSYVFQQKIVLEITATDGGDEVINMTQFMGDDAVMILIGTKEESRIISDYKNNSMLMLNDEDLTGTAISMAFMESATQGFGMEGGDVDYGDAFSETSNLSCKELRNSKIIAGYTCKNWVCENDSVHFEAWYTDEVLFDFQDKRWGKMSNLFSMSNMRKDGEGTVLEVKYYDKIEKETATFKVVELDSKVNLTFDTSKYTFPTTP